jgi:hypothetical protein
VSTILTIGTSGATQNIQLDKYACFNLGCLTL